jgi:UDP-glucose 4-epimerase
MKNILVTGVAGFIGSYLAEDLLSNGHHVWGVDNLSNGSRENLALVLDNQRFNFFEHDVCDEKFIQNLLTKNDISEVWHLAANTDIITSHTAPIRDFIDCAQATVSVLEAMRLSKTKKLVFASSGSVYGNLGNGTAVTESVGPLKPLSTYGAGKLASEGFISAYSNLYGFESYVFRFGNVLGDRINHGVIFDFARKLKNNSKTLLVLGNGQQEKNYFRVNDCIQGMKHISDSKIGESECLIINLGNSTLTNVLRIAELVIEEAGFAGTLIEIEGKDLAWPGDQPIIRLDCSIANSFGWECELDSEQAVRLTARELLKLARVT